MGYYDTQKPMPNAGGQPYNVRDILLATQGLAGGIDALVKTAGDERKAKQQMKANEYVSGLLGKATADTYKQDLLNAGSMAPYASPELMKQVDTARAGFQRGEDIAYRDLTRKEDVDFRNLEHSDKVSYQDKTFKESQRQYDLTYRQTAELAAQRDKLQLQIAAMQEAGAEKRSIRSAQTQMAGIDRQIKAQENQMLRLDKQAEIAEKKANTEYVRKLLGDIDINTGTQAHASTLSWWQPQDTSRVSEYGMGAKNLLLKNAGNLTPDQARYFKGLFDTGRFGQAVAELKAAGAK